MRFEQFRTIYKDVVEVYNTQLIRFFDLFVAPSSRARKILKSKKYNEYIFKLVDRIKARLTFWGAYAGLKKR